MITPRATRLVRVPGLADFRAALVDLALDGPPPAARDRLIVVPTRAAAAHLRRTIEDRGLPRRAALVLPDVVVPGELVARLAERLPLDTPVLSDTEREVLLGVACRVVEREGVPPPFQLRPALVAEMLHFHDILRRQGQDVDAFERVALGVFEPGAADDRGAERLVRQTRFLAASFRELERRIDGIGLDEHRLRRHLLTIAAPRPYRHAIVAVGDRMFDAHGLHAADWDLLARLPGLERLDVVITETMLAGAPHERLHHLLPGIEEVRFATGEPECAPRLEAAPGDPPVLVARDREEEVAAFARRVKRAVRRGDLPALDRAALVVRQPLPYVYLAREVLRSGGIPCQLFDALPLAGEPYAVALDLVMTAVSSDFARGALIDLMRSPHLRWGVSDEIRAGAATAVSPGDVAALERALAEAGHAGSVAALDRLVALWRASAPERGLTRRALRAGVALAGALGHLEPLGQEAPAADHLTGLLAFLATHEQPPPAGEPERTRHLRARGAVHGVLETLRDAHARYDQEPVPFDRTAGLVRRWIESHTFAPRSGEDGVHVVDASAARFGAFTDAQLAGLVDGEWPDPPRRSIFYGPGLLRDLGWPGDAGRRAAARAEFRDLLRLPSRSIAVSSFTLEADTLTTLSPLIDEIAPVGLARADAAVAAVRIFDHEALTSDPVDVSVLAGGARVWAEARLHARAPDDPRFHGAAGGVQPGAWAVSALERYQDCPFRFFAADVLRLEEPYADEGAAPRVRGRFLHDVFRRFFEDWDARGGGTLAPERLDEARALLEEIAEPLLDRLPEPDRTLERTRLFGSAIGLGVADVVLGLEAARPVDVRARLLEYRLDGTFSLGLPGGRRVALTGVADRIDLLGDRRLRVIDYKSGQPPAAQRALQVPVYALCAQERLSARDGVAWEVDEAAYVALAARRALVPVVKAGDPSGAEALAGARARLLAVVEGIDRGEFPPRPHDPRLCRICAYPAVCRKDYVGDA